ncbi:creatininase family protein [Acuticoccus kandeliae]|uniref:creatininase family protein n=1 Tax=Acuticoccus kandeliae TaxID=2073160 RepID=UPI000D3E1934|nr:creatininase family protein [Acuticoccus kandeliae]
MPFPYILTDSHRDIPLYEELTSPDVAAAAAAGAHVIISTGATEQHGGHLPLGTDTYQCLEFAKRAAYDLNKAGVPVLVGPSIPFGPSPLLTESPKVFAGTINVSPETLRRLTEEVVREIVSHGFRVVYLICGHAESDPVLQLVAKAVSETTDASVLTLQWLVGIREKYKGVMRSPRPQSHAGEGETARMLVTAPHLVRLGEAASYHPSLPTDPAPEDRAPYLGGAIGRYKYPPHVFANFEDGIWGDPANATAEVGETSYRLINDWLCEAIRKEYALWKDVPR